MEHRCRNMGTTLDQETSKVSNAYLVDACGCQYDAARHGRSHSYGKENCPLSGANIRWIFTAELSIQYLKKSDREAIVRRYTTATRLGATV